MLLLLLIFTVALMAVSMAMSLLKARSEEKSLAGNLWIALSCLSLITVMAISYLMIATPAPLQPAAAHAETASAQTAASQTAASQTPSPQAANDPQAAGMNGQATAAASETALASTAQQTTDDGPGTAAQQTANAGPANSDNQAAGSYDYLVEVLEAIKRGQPIPDKYLEMLPESARKQLGELYKTVN